MLNLIYDRTADDVANPYADIPRGSRVNTAEDITLFGDGGSGTFHGEAGSIYEFEVMVNLPYYVQIYRTSVATGTVSITMYMEPRGVSQFAYEPEEEEYAYIVLSNFSGVSTVEQMARTIILFGTGKGFYRHTDLNRVQNAVAYLRGVMASAGYNNIPEYILPGWTENDIPRADDMDKYIRSVLSLSGHFPMPGAPVLPRTADRLDWRGANAIEEFLAMLEDALARIAEAWFFSGEVYTGEVDA